MDLPGIHGNRSGFVSSQNWRPTASSLASANEMTAADWWFAGLDQRTFTVYNGRWTARVLGVHLEGFDTWIQLEFAEEPASFLLLHLTGWAGLHDALDMIHADILRRFV